jgi:hypothetical protein
MPYKRFIALVVEIHSMLIGNNPAGICGDVRCTGYRAVTVAPHALSGQSGANIEADDLMAK